MNGRSRPEAAPKTPAKVSESTVGRASDSSGPTTPDIELPFDVEDVTSDAPEAPARSGLARAADNASDWWWSPAMKAMRWMADSGQPFECWDLSQLGVPDPDSPARWGALFGTAAKAGVIQQHGYTRSRRPGRASGVTRTWVGVR